MKILALCLSLALPALACAQADEPRTQYFRMDKVDVVGNALRPNMMRLTADQKAKHDKLLKLKRSFLPKLKATAKAHALR